MEWLLKQHIAHRGLHTQTVCENSLNAFAQAVEHGYAIELDIHMTKDGKLVVFHDFNTFKLTNKDLEIEKSNYSALRVLKLLNTQDHVPLLKEVLDLVKGKVPLIIEIKSIVFDGRLEEELANLLDMYKGRFAVCSFNYKSMEWFQKNRPYMNRGLLFGEERKLGLRDFFNFMYCFDMTKPNFVSLNYTHLESKIVRFCKLIKIPLVIWTINSKEKAKKALKVADNIIFESIKP